VLDGIDEGVIAYAITMITPAITSEQAAGWRESRAASAGYFFFVVP
jgi:hypothetical protein